MTPTRFSREGYSQRAAWSMKTALPLKRPEDQAVWRAWGVISMLEGVSPEERTRPARTKRQKYVRRSGEELRVPVTSRKEGADNFGFWISDCGLLAGIVNVRIVK